MNPKVRIEEFDLSTQVSKATEGFIAIQSDIPPDQVVIMNPGSSGIRWWHYLIPGRVKKMRKAFKEKIMREFDEKFGHFTPWFPQAGFTRGIVKDCETK